MDVFYLRQEYHQFAFRNTLSAQKYTLGEIVGNVEGYMGLFLGYAMIQLARLIMSLLHSPRTSIQKKRTYRRYNMNKSNTQRFQQDVERK